MYLKKWFEQKESLLYGQVLDWVVKLCLLLMAISFLIYVGGGLPQLMALDQVAQNWHLSLSDFQRATHRPLAVGWQLREVGLSGEFICRLCIQSLCSASLLSLVLVCVKFYRHRDWIYVAITLANLAILGLAMGGFF